MINWARALLSENNKNDKLTTTKRPDQAVYLLLLTLGNVFFRTLLVSGRHLTAWIDQR
jgi:hypothetical protein